MSQGTAQELGNSNVVVGRGEGGNPTALVLRYGLCSQLSKASTPEKQKKMTFDYFAGKTADVWEMEEGLSGLSLDSAKDKQLSPTEDDSTTTDTFTAKVKLGIMWLAWYACACGAWCVRVCTYIHSHVHANMHTQNTHTYASTCTHTRTHTHIRAKGTTCVVCMNE